MSDSNRCYLCKIDGQSKRIHAKFQGVFCIECFEITAAAVEGKFIDFSLPKKRHLNFLDILKLKVQRL